MINSRSKLPLVNNQSNVLSLLVTPLGNSKYAGLASKLSISALPVRKGETAELRFNQDVGESMNSALDEVIRYLRLKHKGWPGEYQIELAFSEKYSAKDGPSAAVATAILMESLITGVKLNETFAVTGDMNAAGDVQAIGGVFAKLRGARKGAQLLLLFQKRIDYAL